eukprot:Gb_29880 [translate_table: standard]
MVFQPNTCASLLQSCTHIKTLKQLHAYMVITGLDQNIYFGTKFIDMYAKCGSPVDARLVFDNMPKRNVFSWNAMIGVYAREGRCEETLRVYYKMKVMGIQSNNFTFPFVLKACAGISALQQGKEIHQHIVAVGFESDVFVAAALLDMYAKCGNIEDARNVFDRMRCRDVVSWNAMIAGYARNEHTNEAVKLFNKMQLADVKPNSITIVSVLPACACLGALPQGKGIHVHIIKSGYGSNLSVENSLVAMYAKCGHIELARHVFDKMSERDEISWNTVIMGYVQNGHANDALTLFHEMQRADVEPDLVTMASVLSACSHVGALQQGQRIHNYICRSVFESDVFVENSLMDMYAKCGRIDFARRLFDRMSRRDVVSWNVMVAGYAQCGYANEALAMFYQMQLAGMKPDSNTITSLLSACAHLGDLQRGKWIHDYIIRGGTKSDVFVENSLIGMYGKCGSVDDARRLFHKMFRRDVVSWNAMIAGYTQNGYASEAFTLFYQMQLVDITPDTVTMLSVLSACAQLGALHQGKWIHNHIVKRGFESDVSMGNSLVDMYAKCGSIEFALFMFDSMSKRDVVSWNVMIAGYGMHGQGKDALALFSQMQQTGLRPNHITFVCVLSACSHSGLVNEGWQYFDCMSREYCIMPIMKHYACMVDLLGRAGHLDEAWDFIKTMPCEPDASVWGALLGACRIHLNFELGEHTAENLFHLEPENAGYFVLLSNMYAAAGRWDGVAKVRTLMKDKGLKKTPGCSFTEVNNSIHAFLVGDKSHPQSEKIYATLETLIGQMKEEGYLPDTSSVLHDVEEEEKGYILCSHSEKLAIVFGLINTSRGTPIKITKNLRVCSDCHIATKFISKIVRREIIVRDANRFHYFKDGLCSCGNYW